MEIDGGKEHLFSAKFSCPICGYSIAELEPRLFSFNNPMGACQSCDGLGAIQFFDPKRVVAFPHLSLASGAIKGWDRRNQFYYQMLQSLAAFYKFDLEQTFEKMPQKVQDMILSGSGKEKIPFQLHQRKGPHDYSRACVRRRDPESRTALQGNRLADGARGTGQIHQQQDLPLIAPARACAKKRATCASAARRFTRYPANPSRKAWAFSKTFRSKAHKAADRRASIVKEIASAHELPERCRPRLSLARPFGRIALGRRSAAHPPRLANRLRPHRRDVCARRAFDRPAPARQRPPARHFQAPARPRQHRDRGRA